MSGGEGQEPIAFILGAASQYRLGDVTTRIPTYAPIVLDEGLSKPTPSTPAGRSQPCALSAFS